MPRPAHDKRQYSWRPKVCSTLNSPNVSTSSHGPTIAMAEAIAVIGFVSAIASLADYGERVVKRLNEFRRNVKELPQSFLHISVQLPLLVDIIHRLHDQSKKGGLTPTTEGFLKPVLDGLRQEIRKLDAVLGKILPSADASTWEKSVKALKSVGVQKDVDAFAAIIRDYVANLTAFQTTHNSDLIRRLGVFLAEQQSGSHTYVDFRD